MSTTATSTAPPPSSTHHSTADPWTTEQEAALLKALVIYKPVGLHAHFRMLAIRNSLLQSGTIDPDAPHTRIPGIWTKLRTLYDLPRLDEREDAIFTSLDTTFNQSSSRADKPPTAPASYWHDFELTGPTPTTSTTDPQRDDLASLMWERRLAPEGTSPSTSSASNSDSDEPSTATHPRSSRRTKTRVSRLKHEDGDASTTDAGSARASRRASKAASEADDGDRTMEDVEDEESGEGEEQVSDSAAGSGDEGEKRGGIGGARRGRGGRRARGKRGRRRGG